MKFYITLEKINNKEIKKLFKFLIFGNDFFFNTIITIAKKRNPVQAKIDKRIKD